MQGSKVENAKRSQKDLKDVMKLLIGVGQMIWFGYTGKLVLLGGHLFFEVNSARVAWFR